MKWEQFERMNQNTQKYANKVLTNIECPKCGKNLFQRTDIILTSYPCQYQYECECSFIGYSFSQRNEGSGKVGMKEYPDWDDGCYEKLPNSNDIEQYEPDEKGWRYGAKNSKYSEEIKDELVSLMIKYLENHEIFRLLELVVSAAATKE